MVEGLVTKYKKEGKDCGENLMVGTCCLWYPYAHGKLWVAICWPLTVYSLWLNKA